MAILIFSKVNGYRHDNIAASVSAVSALVSELGEQPLLCEDARHFTPEGLARVRSVIWLNTSGDVLLPEQRRAFAAFIRAGGGYVGVHSASASEPSWDLYAEIVGARFTGHPEPCTTTLVVEDRSHPATRHLRPSWTRWDEWYEFDRDPRPNVHVLISVRASSVPGATQADHPLVWCHSLGQGRCFYTALGHSIEDYSDPVFLKHLEGGIRWASSLEASPASES